MLITVFNAISHFLVDAACVAALFSFGTEALALSSAVVVYNTLAFSTQCLVGLLMDRVLKRGRTRSDYLMLCGTVQAAAMFVVAAAARLGHDAAEVVRAEADERRAFLLQRGEYDFAFLAIG